MITDISLTPRQQLSRMLYDFSATMYEIGDGHSLETLDALGIIDIPRVDENDNNGSQPPIDYRTVMTVGQLYEFYPTNNRNIINAGEIYDSLMDKYNYGGVYSQKEINNIYIKNVQIYFHNEPHMFHITENGIRLITDPTGVPFDQIKLGYTFNMCTDTGSKTTIFVNERGYYQIPAHLHIKELSFNQYSDANGRGDKVTVNYIVVYNERNSARSIISGQSIDRSLIGQYQGVYKPYQYLGETIRSRYNYVTPLYTQRMQYWRGISLDVTPYAIASIKYRNSSDYVDYLVGQTGILHLLQDFPIIDMYFSGRQMFKQPFERQKYLADHEYVVSEEVYDSIQDIRHPAANTVYHVGGQDMIYYHNIWANFNENRDETGIAMVNVEGAINFIGDVVQISY